eukprot:2141912-Rhodomonas_salina.2
MGRMLELEPDFPEVATGLRFCVPTSLLHLWDPARSLSSFDEQLLLSSGAASRHVVYKVRAGAAWFAVKEYLLDQAELPRALNEASLLHRLRHPALVELVGIFIDDMQDTAKVYLQMPFYEHGPLDSWVEARGPSFLSVRQVPPVTICEPRAPAAPTRAPFSFSFHACLQETNVSPPHLLLV